jgi:hypothetical protein
VDRLVVRIRGYAVDHLVVVRELDPQDVRSAAGQRPVVRAAAPPETVAGPVNCNARADHDVRGRYGLDPE